MAISDTFSPKKKNTKMGICTEDNTFSRLYYAIHVAHTMTPILDREIKKHQKTGIFEKEESQQGFGNYTNYQNVT